MTLDLATLLYTYISRFSVNPHYQQREKIRQSCRHKFYPQPFLVAFFNFSHKRPTFAFTGESGYTHSAFGERWHTRRNRGVSDGGGITTLGAFRMFTNIPGPGVRTANFAAFGAWSGVLPKNAESLRNSDALMRVAVPQALCVLQRRLRPRLKAAEFAVLIPGPGIFVNVQLVSRVMIPPPSETSRVSPCKPLCAIFLRRPSVYPLSPVKANVGRLCEKLKIGMKSSLEQRYSGNFLAIFAGMGLGEKPNFTGRFFER